MKCPLKREIAIMIMRHCVVKVLTVRKADRQKDKGVYKIRLTCEGGNFEATGYVNVLDVPSRPRALKPDEVRKKIFQC